jgi:hypothetical protein
MGFSYRISIDFKAFIEIIRKYFQTITKISLQFLLYFEEPYKSLLWSHFQFSSANQISHKNKRKHAASTKSWLRDWEICVSALNLSCFLRLEFQSCTCHRKASAISWSNVSFRLAFGSMGCVSQTPAQFAAASKRSAFRKAAWCAYFPYLVSTYALLNAYLSLALYGPFAGALLDGRRWTASMQPHLGCRSFTPHSRRVLNLRETLIVASARTHTGCAIVL